MSSGGIYDDDQATEEGNVNQDLDGTVSGGQKHILLEVPDYDHQTSADHPRSFLQLGAYPSDAITNPKKWGEDLLNLAGVPTSAGSYFKDDYREEHGQQHPDAVYHRDDGTGAGLYTSTDHDPAALTGQLRTRGGWRQHTDGNHITTTRGDRVDVVFGNYKMSVLGRMDLVEDVDTNPPGWGETYIESSGGHNRWATNTQGDRVMVEWSPHGCWRVYDETVKGHTIDRYQGVQEEIYELRTKESYIGTSSSPIQNGGGAIPASSVSDSTGPHSQQDQATKWINPSGGFNGTGWPRNQQNPTVTERVKAKDIDETTKVTSGMGSRGSSAIARDPGSITERTRITGKKNDDTLAAGAHLRDEITCDGGVTITSHTGIGDDDTFPVDYLTHSGVGVSSDNRRIDTYLTVSAALGKFGSEVYGLKEAVGKGGWTFNLNLVAVNLDISANVESITVPNFTVDDPNPFNSPFRPKGPNRHTFGLNVGNTLESGVVGLALDITVGLTLALKSVTKIDLSTPDAKELYLLTIKTDAGKTVFKTAWSKTDATHQDANGARGST